MFPSSDDTFVTANQDNTVSLFINGEVKKTKQFTDGWLPVIACVNGETIYADGENNLLVLNENLETKRVLNPENEFDPELHTYFIITGNEAFIAAATQHEVRCYWRHGGREPMVRQLIEILKVVTLLSF